MTLGEFACLLNVEPKWVQNVAATLGRQLPYTLPTARRLAVARTLTEALGVPTPRAFDIATALLRRYRGSRSPFPVPGIEGPVVLMVDVHRILAAVATGLSRLRTSYAPRRRGRPSAPRDPIRAATAYGLDPTLLAANLRRTPAERLRQLDAMVDFRRRVRRSLHRLPRGPMFEQIIVSLVGAGIRFVVIGGVAATIQGSARLTNDIDLCYDTSPRNVHALVRLLREWHPYLRGVERGLPFVLDVRALRATPIMTLTTDMGDVDIFDRVPGIGTYADALAASELVKIGSTEFRVLTLPALIRAKKATGRPRDREHLIELEALLAMRRKMT